MFHITEAGKEQDTMFVMESTVIWSINISSLDTIGKEEKRTMAPAKDLQDHFLKEVGWDRERRGATTEHYISLATSSSLSTTPLESAFWLSFKRLTLQASKWMLLVMSLMFCMCVLGKREENIFKIKQKKRGIFRSKVGGKTNSSFILECKRSSIIQQHSILPYPSLNLAIFRRWEDQMW